MVKRAARAIFLGLAVLSFLVFLASTDFEHAAGAFHSAMFWGVLGWLTAYSLHEPTEEEFASGALLRHRRLGLAFLMACLRSTRLVRKIRRWCFRGRAPEWAGDLYGLLGYFNFVGILPTIAAMVATPEHFFARVPSNGQAFNSVYKPPIKLLTSFAALLAVLLGAAFPEIASGLSVRTVVIGAAPLIPLVMLGLCAVILVLEPLARPNILRSLWRRSILVTPEIVSTIFSWRTYTGLDRTRYLWSVMYFYVYCYVALFSMMISSGIVSLLLGDSPTGYYTASRNPALHGGFTPPAVALVALVLTGSRWLVYRYALLLRYTKKRRPQAEMDLAPWGFSRGG